MLVRSLELFDTNLMSWTKYSSAQSTTYPWITAWTDPVGPSTFPTSSTNGFIVQTDNYAAYDTIAPATYQLRMKV